LFFEAFGHFEYVRLPESKVFPPPRHGSVALKDYTASVGGLRAFVGAGTVQRAGTIVVSEDAPIACQEADDQGITQRNGEDSDGARASRGGLGRISSGGHVSSL
jgi:hypothetical protein